VDHYHHLPKGTRTSLGKDQREGKAVGIKHRKLTQNGKLKNALHLQENFLQATNTDIEIVKRELDKCPVKKKAQKRVAQSGGQKNVFRLGQLREDCLRTTNIDIRIVKYEDGTLLLKKKQGTHRKENIQIIGSLRPARKKEKGA